MKENFGLKKQQKLEQKEENPFTLEDLDMLSVKLHEQLNETNLEERPRIIEEFLKGECFGRKERFESVFETDDGSIFFVLASGESWCLKKEEGRYEPQSIYLKTIFVSPDTLAELLKDDPDQTKISEKEIQTVAPSVGTIPIQIGLIGVPGISLEENEHTVTIHGTGYEMGMPIEKVIK